MTAYVITARAAPALGDIRAAGQGDWFDVYPDVVERRDFSKIWEAVGVAFVRGADVCLLREER
ncbi:hypothetical protein ACIP88_05145 [Streptomyces uncialis]|uniref:hypothetical protein n=1 Tax=Streptomyces uncialis TaxID=1048205 RepID=UPI0037F63761